METEFKVLGEKMSTFGILKALSKSWFDKIQTIKYLEIYEWTVTVLFSN